MLVSAETKRRVSSHKKTLPTYIVHFLCNTKTNFHCRNKNIICQRGFFNKNCAMSAEKYQSGLFHDRCQLLSFLFNPWITIGWCRLGNVRSAPSGEASFLDLDRSSFLADADCHFFRSISVNHAFCQGGLTSSWLMKWDHASVGRNTISHEKP